MENDSGIQTLLQKAMEFYGDSPTGQYDEIAAMGILALRALLKGESEELSRVKEMLTTMNGEGA